MAYGSIIGQIPYLGINATAVLQENVVAITSTQTYANLITFYAPSDFDENNTYTFNGTSITLQDLNNNPIIDGWKSGSPITFYIKGTEAFFKVGGGINDTLPPQVTNFVAIAGDAQVTLSWDAIASEYQQYLQQYVIVYKQNGIPIGVNDGTKVIVPNSETQTVITQLANDTLYGFRMFPVNYKGQYQTDPTAQATATPTEINKGKRFVFYGNKNFYIYDNQLNLLNTIPSSTTSNIFYTNGAVLTDDYLYVIQGSYLITYDLSTKLAVGNVSVDTGQYDDDDNKIYYSQVAFNEVDGYVYLSTDELNWVKVLNTQGNSVIREMKNWRFSGRIYDDGNDNIIAGYSSNGYDDYGAAYKTNKLTGSRISTILPSEMGSVDLIDDDDEYFYFTRSEFSVRKAYKVNKNDLSVAITVNAQHATFTSGLVMSGRMVEGKYISLQKGPNGIIFDMTDGSQYFTSSSVPSWGLSNAFLDIDSSRSDNTVTITFKLLSPNLTEIKNATLQYESDSGFYTNIIIAVQ